MTDAIFITLDYLKANSSIHENVDGKTIRPYIALSMDKYILPAMGTNLYNKLILDVKNNTLSGNYLILMQTYIQPALLYYVTLESCRFINYQFTNKSIVTKKSDTSDAVDMDVVIFLEERIASSAQYYAERLIRYLRANTTLFPELLAPGTGVDTIFPVLSEYFNGIHIPYNNWAGAVYYDIFNRNRIININY